MEKTQIVVRFQEDNDLQPHTLLVPISLYTKLNVVKLKISYGLKQLAVDLAPAHAVVNETETVFWVSSSVVKELHLLKGKVKIEIDPQKIMIGPFLGLMLGDRTVDYTPEYMLKHYQDRVLMQAQHHLIIAAFSLDWIDYESASVHALVFQAEENSWAFQQIPVPTFIYRRHLKQKEFESFKKWYQDKGGTLFNTLRPDKWLVHEQFMKVDSLSGYLPKTEQWTRVNQLENWLVDHKKFVLKPVLNSQGRGIVIVSKVNKNRFELLDYRHTDQAIRKKMSTKRFLRYVNKHNLIKKNYLLQEWIPLKKLEGSPFDIRVFTQKQKNEWVINGIECRQALPKEEITNLSKGGNVLTLQQAVLKEEEQVRNQINSVCRKIAQALESIFPEDCFVEFGIDLAIDEKQDKLYLIEVNFRPGYKGLKIIDQQAYYRVCWAPFLYSINQQGFN